MKILVKLCLTLILLSATTLAFAGSKNHIRKTPAPSYEGMDSTNNNKPKEKKGGDGGTTWTVTLFVNDATAKPITGATVSAPCTGQPSKTTDSTGKVVFSGNAPCPCAESQATVTTKDCTKYVNVSCGNTYSVTCP